MTKKFLAALAGSSVVAIVVATPALAQVTAPTGANAATTATENEEAIVITGTQIRGIAPPGSNTLTVSEAQIDATGATNTQQLLATIPQTSAFNNLGATLPGQGVSAGVTRVPIARPNIRNLPGCAGSGSGACTLILLDGHRIVPAGIEQTAVDPNIIPPGIIARLEAILDGNSAVYGSDAIGGVINFITRKRFEGVRMDARYGVGHDYDSFDANATVGFGWDSGSIVATYSYGRNDDVFGRDRDYNQNINFATGLPTGTQCNTPNVSANGVTFAAPAFVAGTVNRCDISQDATLYPKNRRHTGFATLTQDFGENFTFGVSGFYSDFRTESNTGPARGSVTVANFPLPIPIPGAGGPNQFFQLIPSVPTVAPGLQTYSVLFSYGPALGDDFGTQVVRFKTWQVTPSLTVDLGSDWQATGLFSYGHNRTTTLAHTINPITQLIAAGATAAPNPANPFSQNALNPLNVAATSPTTLAALGSWFDRGIGVNKMYNGVLKADGTLFEMPGGAAKAAIGVEYLKTSFTKQVSNILTLAMDPAVSGSVESKSIFGEVFLPIVGENNEGDLAHRLSLSLSARYDHYDQGVGGTFNPKVGITYEPIDWLTLRANWGKNFNAPTPADRVGETLTRVLATTCGNPCAFAPSAVPLPPSSTYNIIFVTGTTPGLTPQKSTNWALGFDLRPPFIENLKISATYYNIKIKNFISLPQIGADIQQGFRDFPELVVDRTEIAAVPGTAPNGLPNAVNTFCSQFGAAGVATCIGANNGLPFAALIDNRTRNLGLFKIAGIDFSVDYRSDTSFGSVDVRFNANHQLKRDFAPHQGDPLQNTLFEAGVSDFTSALTVGANIGDFRAQGTWNHTGGYNFRAAPGIHLQDHVGSFDTVDFFFRYDLGDLGFVKNAGVTLNVNNAFDAKPPIFRSTVGLGNGVAPNIRTLGRVVLVGIDVGF